MATTWVTPIKATPLIVRTNPSTFAAEIGRLHVGQRAMRDYETQTRTEDDTIWMKVYLEVGLSGWVMICKGNKSLAEMTTE
jgi:hypothetical protein